MSVLRISDISMDFKLIGYFDTVLRVSWLKARARYERWREELDMVRREMLWVAIWFQHQQKEWERREREATEPGHKAYAAKQQSLWASFKRNAEVNFEKC